MKILIMMLTMTFMMLDAEQSLPYNLLSQLQQNEQKKHIKKTSVSYSEAAYHMAEGAAVTAVVCLPTMYCFKFMGFEAMSRDELPYANYPFLPLCAALLQISPGFSWQFRYALKAYNSRQPQAIKKEYDQQSHTFTLEPVSYQDKLNAHAKLAGSVLAMLGIGVAVYRSLND